MSKDKAKSFFDVYGEAISIVKAQVLYNEARINLETATQGYFEHSGLASQQELVPCRIFPDVEFYMMEGELASIGDVFIPASEGYFPPVATIHDQLDCNRC